MSAPVQIATGSLGSLWDLLDRYALTFSEIAARLARLDDLWRHHPRLRAAPNPMTPDDEVTAEHRQWRLEESLNTLTMLRSACEGIELAQLLPQIDRFKKHLEATALPGVPAMRDPKEGIRHLRERITDELQHEWFAHVRRADVALYGQAELFGEEVSKKFPKAAEDIQCAGNCLALDQHTAAVFHLMRVMEIGVRALGTKLRVKINVEIETWYKISEHVDGAIKGLPAKTEPNKRRKAELAASSQHLNLVRIAVRNEVMHPKQTYMEAEAREVFTATRTFMVQLAKLV